MDLDPVDLRQGQAGQSERPAGLGREAPADMVDVNPVPELQGARTEPGHQAGLTQHFSFAGIEDCVYESDSRVKLGFEAAEPSFDVAQLSGPVQSGRNPGAYMLATEAERRLEERRIGRLPATENETRGLDALWWDSIRQPPWVAIPLRPEHRFRAPFREPVPAAPPDPGLS